MWRENCGCPHQTYNNDKETRMLHIDKREIFTQTHTKKQYKKGPARKNYRKRKLNRDINGKCLANERTFSNNIAMCIL